mmetsp:Transcript_18495/g.48027  ORF Transcript_18495/g.48027 Transcript_18495/m.48027 type:complete len:213 (+) Transcript_18495:563-1201(+)
MVIDPWVGHKRNGAIWPLHGFSAVCRVNEPDVPTSEECRQRVACHAIDNPPASGLGSGKALESTTCHCLTIHNGSVVEQHGADPFPLNHDPFRENPTKQELDEACWLDAIGGSADSARLSEADQADNQECKHDARWKVAALREDQQHFGHEDHKQVPARVLSNTARIPWDQVRPHLTVREPHEEETPGTVLEQVDNQRCTITNRESEAIRLR